MIITKTPLRVSLFGGGTDFDEYLDEYGGIAISVAIDKYIYVIVNDRFGDEIVVNYSIKELAANPFVIKHDLIRESLLLNNIKNRTEITTLSDIHSNGSGLGSSSAVLIGALNAISQHAGYHKSNEKLFQEACRIEIDILKKPIGIQDQAAAAFGGFGTFEFAKEREVRHERFNLTKDSINDLLSNFLLFYTRKDRQSSIILERQNNSIQINIPYLHEIKALAQEAKSIIELGNYDDLGLLLDKSWKIKKRLASGISNSEINQMYDTSIRAGALGGKIVGAGGGGFLLLYCPKNRKEKIINALQSYPCLPLKVSSEGSRVVFNDN